MANLQKRFLTLMIIIFIVVIVGFIGDGVIQKAVSSQGPKLVNNPVNVVKKRVITPNKARNFLNDLDMQTRDYLKMEVVGAYGQYEADSDGLVLETRDPDRFINNLSYSVFGDKYVVRAVELVLNVNDLSFSSNAVGELVKYSDNLMYKVTGNHLTPPIKKAILAKNSGEWLMDGYRIKLKKDIFPDEKIIKGVESTSDHGAFSLIFLIEL